MPPPMWSGTKLVKAPTCFHCIVRKRALTSSLAFTSTQLPSISSSDSAKVWRFQKTGTKGSRPTIPLVSRKTSPPLRQITRMHVNHLKARIMKSCCHLTLAIHALLPKNRYFRTAQALVPVFWSKGRREEETSLHRPGSNTRAPFRSTKSRS